MRQNNTYKLGLLVLALMMILAGCSSTKNGNNRNEPAAANNPANGQDAAAPAGSDAPDAPEELPQVELSWYYGTSQQQPDQQAVEDAVNQYLKDNTDLNATVKLKPVDFGSYDQKLNVSISSGEPIDIVWTTASWLLKYNENVKKGAFLALDDLLPKYAPKTFNDMMPARFWEDVKADTDGKIYAVPSYQVAATAFGFVFQKRFTDKYNFDTTQVKSLEDLEPFLETLKKNEPDVIPFAFQAGNNGPQDPALKDYSGGITYNPDDPYKNIDKLATPQYKSYLELMHSWYEKGYIYQDLATVKDWNQLLAKGNVAVITDVTFKPGGDVSYPSKNGGNEVVMQRIAEPQFTGVTATMNAISNTSKNPERALMLLELVNNDKELYKLLSYGIKGKHYEEVDGVYKPLENSGYAPNIDWVFGNQFNGLVRENQPADVFEQTKKLNEEAAVPPLSGFHFNDSDLKTESAAVSAVNAEYKVPLETGTVDPAEMLPKYLEALKKAGYDKIQAAINQQLADWVAKNGK
ncbi:ABC transporter substrate-binding protein [Paenibacillus sepulcri]|uniref:ABC transporter substrate-binding protein n=1 Tax=Paenibacillus sepulcri TaxID=359917 RepID=A0ABS7C359_9BACL|nr:ABC transporter substrate-binding protein [Paenibacillus sepulcri]